MSDFLLCVLFLILLFKLSLVFENFMVLILGIFVVPTLVFFGNILWEMYDDERRKND